MARRKKGDKVDGWINLNKPLGLTSTQALGKVRRYLNAQKGGHAGTLDPLATGVLPIALGEATKTIPYMQDADKIYSFTVKWGEQTSTDDKEGEIIATSNHRPTKEEIEAILTNYTGEIEQIPPKYSAIKIDGQRAYDLARAGKDVEIKSRIVIIHDLEIISPCHSDRLEGEEESDHALDPSTTLGITSEGNGMTFDGEATQEYTTFRTHCGKGTYVRALARDIALELGTYAHVTTLTREAVGDFSIQDTISLDKLEEMGHSAALEEALLPVDSVLDDIPVLPLTTAEHASLRNGQALSFISKGDFHRVESLIEGMEPTTALALYDDQPVGMIEIKGPTVKPIRLFNL